MSKLPKKMDFNRPGKTSTDLVASRDNIAGVASLIESNPLVALLGGMALGVAAGALIPRSDREKVLLSPVGDRIGNALHAALAAGREAGGQALIDAGLTADGLRDQVSGLFSQASAAAAAAGSAAFIAAKDKVKG